MKPMSQHEVAQVAGGIDYISFLPPDSTVGPFSLPGDQTPAPEPTPTPTPEYP